MINGEIALKIVLFLMIVVNVLMRIVFLSKNVMSYVKHTNRI